jgi:transglutaminase-like putative cysteine protease
MNFILKTFLLGLAICILGIGHVSADNLYPAFTIPEALKTNAYAVVRLHETTFTVTSPGEAIEKIHYVITILNERGQKQAVLGVPYDKLSKVNSIEGALYDTFGKQVKKLKKSDIEDISTIGNGQLFMDNRAKVAQFTYVQYPYTVEFEYEVVNHNMLFYPRWEPQDDDEVSVEKASLTIHMPAGMDLRYKEMNLAKSATVTPTSNGKQYVWQVSNLPTFKSDDYAPFLSQQVPMVYTTPSDFEVEGYKGSMRSWADISKFFYDLNKDRDELPEPVKQKANQLVANEKTPVQKIKKLYEYMQANTRYVGVQLGIGGWQTIPANVVAEKGYGDCKALSNYMKALLKAVGIPAYCASVRAGDGEETVLPDFPNPYFNHVILCVPLSKDTLWLECTSQTGAFGYQGSFTGNRYALLEMPSGGKLLKTTHYSATDNLQSRTAKVQLSESGDAQVEVATQYHGQQQDQLDLYIHNYDTEEQRKMLYKRINIPSFEINQFSFRTTKNRIPVLTESLLLTIRKCGSKSGTRMFITPNLMNAAPNAPQKSENRKSDFVIHTSFMDADTVIYQLPKGYGIEFVPEAVKIDSKFGSYQSSLQTKDSEITYIRTMTVNRGQYPASAYNEWVDFRKKIVKADKTQLVLVNKGL